MTDRVQTSPGVPVSQSLAAFGIFFASVGFGLVPFFSRGLTDEGLAPYAVAFYRYVMTAALLFPVLIACRRAWREICWGLFAGAAMGLGWIGYVNALETIPASTLGVIYMTFPVFTVLLAWLLFADTPSRRAWIASGLIVVAALIAGNPATVPAEHMLALLGAAIAPLTFGLSICILVHRLSRLPPLARIASVAFGSMIALLPLMVTSTAEETLPSDTSAWVLIAGIALVTALIPQLIYMICSPIVGASRSAVIGSVELLTMFAVGVFAFGEVLTLSQVVACALILFAIMLTRSRKTSNVASQMTRPK